MLSTDAVDDDAAAAANDAVGVVLKIHGDISCSSLAVMMQKFKGSLSKCSFHAV